MIHTVPKTVETGGTIYRLCGYTYFCAEEPDSRGPTIERTATVEPDVATIVQEVNNKADRLIVSERGKTVRYKKSALLLLLQHVIGYGVDGPCWIGTQFYGQVL